MKDNGEKPRTIPGLLQELMGREIVIDVSSMFVYAGILVDEDDRYLVIESADVHDLRDASTTRELYLLDTRRYGVRTNRKRVLIRRDEIVSISALDDIIG